MLLGYALIGVGIVGILCCVAMLLRHLSLTYAIVNIIGWSVLGIMCVCGVVFILYIANEIGEERVEKIKNKYYKLKNKNNR